MSRIKRTFEQLKLDGRKGFIPFISAGDPDLETTAEIVVLLAELGADIIELGVPFSDPIADGPVIQASSQRSLDAGTTLGNILKMTAELKNRTDVPIVLFSYFNPLLNYGIERLVSDAAASGIDGILITDVIDDEASAISDTLAKNNIDLISLIAPTTTDTRLEQITQRANGFIYAISRAGITGARAESSSEAENLVSRIRRFTDLPIAVGFGISKREHIENVWRYADAAVVGSAIVTQIEKEKERAALLERIRAFTTSLLPKK
ncbi:MAG: tryptophan synthase subunit alpha [Acidobacteria bacterium]|nr:tryptophan synthase subunit alpha [Acidobacteriota bacterium]